MPDTSPGHFTCKATSTGTVIHLYGDIGTYDWGDGVDPDEFVKAVDAIKGGKVDVYINSSGGDAFAGVAMMNALRRCKGEVTVTVDGLAASAASYVALGGRRLVMGRNSQMMIHDASGVCVGNAEAMDHMRATLDKLSDNIASIYAAKAGGTPEHWRDLMRAETWLSAAEAVEHGLADAVDDTATSSPSNEALRFFNRAAAPHDHPAAEPGLETRKEPEMDDILIAGLRDRLGIAADTTDADTILSALDEALTERAAEPPAGTVLIDADALADLRAAAEDGRKARAQQLADAHARLVDAAAADGRVTPASRDRWLKMLASDEATATEVLESLTPTVPVKPLGYTGGVGEADGDPDETLYKTCWGED